MCALASKGFEGARAGSAAVEKDITPMVVARLNSLAMVIFGSRRLYALKEFAKQRRQQVVARALVRCEPFHHLRELKDRLFFNAHSRHLCGEWRRARRAGQVDAAVRIPVV